VQAAMPALPDPDKGDQPGGALLPWAWRVASRIADGTRVSLADLDPAERLQIMQGVVELLEEQVRRAA
jgi:hypothetical protein